MAVKTINKNDDDEVFDNKSLLEISKENLIKYGESVILNRALPDFRDGLKPVHRRILWSMYTMKVWYNGPSVKSSRIVGDCFAKGTLVSTPHAYVPIEELEIGDKVCTSEGVFPVTQLFHNPPSVMVTVELYYLSCCCTLDQEFKVNDAGTLIWKKACDLQLGDKIVTEFYPYYDRVVMIELAETQETYDITVDQVHEFYANGICVKNCVGKYHPHGTVSVYDALVKMVGLPVSPVYGEGSFGDAVEKRPAAERYTEAKLSKYGNLEFFPKHMEDITTLMPNYDGKEKEPLYLPCLMPNMLLNGTSGIAVGITSNIPPIAMESLFPFIEKAIKGDEITAKALLKKLKFNWKYGSHCVSDQSKILDWLENGQGSLLFEPEFEVDYKSRVVAITEAPPYFNWENVLKNLIKTDKKSNKPKYGFVSSVDDMSDKHGIRFEIKFKNTVDMDEFDNHVKAIVREFSNSFSCATNVTFRKTEKPKFYRSNIIDLIQRWAKYRINLEIKIQQHNIDLIDKELKKQDLLLKVYKGRKHIKDAWDSPKPHDYIKEKLKITEDEAKLIFSWNLLSPSRLNNDKIIKEKQDLIISKKQAMLIRDNPSPTVISYLSNNGKT